MLQAALFGGIGGLSLIVGALAGLRFKFSRKITASFMAFGAGVLICAVSFGLIDQSFEHGGLVAVITGFLSGGIVFIIGDYLIHLAGGRKHRYRPLIAVEDESRGRVITLGTILDGIPEAIALGVALSYSGGKGLLLLAAIVLNNFPESISSIPGLKKEAYPTWKILLIWLITGFAIFVITILSYLFLKDLSFSTLGTLEAFAAGALLTMAANSLIPEAFAGGGFMVGFITVVGFLVAFVISKL
ncbi:MAG: ZIP family zinc transporter [Candidatus Berkelbacteria bacterium]|nr:ZIP family zinc transporter [Candidatus Berkelbacteria bacterium]